MPSYVQCVQTAGAFIEIAFGVECGCVGHETAFLQLASEPDAEDGGCGFIGHILCFFFVGRAPCSLLTIERWLLVAGCLHCCAALSRS